MAWQGHINTLRAQVAANNLDITDTVASMLLELAQAEGQSVADALWLIAMVAKAADHKNDGLIRKLAEVGPEHWGAVVHKMEPEPLEPEGPMYRGKSGPNPEVYYPGGDILREAALSLGESSSVLADFDWGHGAALVKVERLAYAILVNAVRAVCTQRGMQPWGVLLSAEWTRGGTRPEGLALKHHKAFAQRFVGGLVRGAPWKVSRDNVLHMLTALENPAGNIAYGEHNIVAVTAFSAAPNRVHTISRIEKGDAAGRFLWHTMNPTH